MPADPSAAIAALYAWAQADFDGAAEAQENVVEVMAQELELPQQIINDAIAATLQELIGQATQPPDKETCETIIQRAFVVARTMDQQTRDRIGQRVREHHPLVGHDDQVMVSGGGPEHEEGLATVSPGEIVGPTSQLGYILPQHANDQAIVQEFDPVGPVGIPCATIEWPNGERMQIELRLLKRVSQTPDDT